MKTILVPIDFSGGLPVSSDIEDSNRRDFLVLQACDADVDWSKAAGFRDVIAHGYFGLDLHVVWDVVQTKLPLICQSVERVLNRFGDRPQ